MSKLIFKKSLPQSEFLTYNDIPNLKLLTVNQVHGASIINKEDHSPDAMADGISLKENENEKLAIKTADCLPVAIIGSNGIALIHAGWRGIQQEILCTKEVSSLAPSYFYIGPHICLENYEVGQEFTKNFPNSHNFKKIKHKIYFNLAHEARDQILKSYPSATIEISELCTFKHPELNSYRQNKTVRRNWNILYYK